MFFSILGVILLRRKVLIAVGDREYTNILKRNFFNYPDDFTLSSQEVFHRQYLLEIVELEKPDILILHDTYLPSSFNTKEGRENELLDFIRLFNSILDESLRFVFLCERPRGDVFLSTLVSLGVRDIFNSNSVPLNVFFEQLIDKPRFTNVEKFLLLNQENIGATIPINSFNEEQQKEETNEEEIHKNISEKPVIQKVVNKNVIKRDYHIQILNQTKKVVGVPVKRKFLLIGSPLPRSGSTFICHLLARAISQKDVSVAYVENPYSKPYTYERFVGDQKTNRYRSKFYEYNNENFTNISTDWNMNQVSFICKNPTHEPIYSSQEIGFDTWIKVLYSIPATITIIDVGSDWDNVIFRDLCDIADHIYIVLDPDISLIRYFEKSKDSSTIFLRELLDTNKASLIGNRFTPKILEKNFIKELYQDVFISMIPTFPAHDVIESQYKGVFLNDYKEYRNILKPLMSPFLNEIIPKELMNRRQISNLFKKVFGKKIAVRKIERK